jgi:hypothetical protein
VSPTSGVLGVLGVLVVLVDGEPMGPDEARAFWGRFSAYLEAHKGDLAGFAKQEGFASVRGGQAVLLVSRSDPQRAYAAVDKGGGSSVHAASPAEARLRRARGPKRAKRDR